MKRASISEIPLTEALSRAFPSYPFGRPPGRADLHITRDEAQRALEELEPYYNVVRSLYGESIESDSENEVWSVFSPESITAHIRDRTSLKPERHSAAVNHAVRAAKSFGLYAHRAVYEDNLLGSLEEYAKPPIIRSRSDDWVLNQIVFSLEVHSALWPLLEKEVVLPFDIRVSPELRSLRASASGQIFSTPEQRHHTVRDIVKYISTTYPRDPLSIDHAAWAGGVIAAGIEGGYLLQNQKDLNVLVDNVLRYNLDSAVAHPRLTVAWQHPKLARLHRYFLEFTASGATQRETDRPFILTELSTNGAINPDKISAREALTLRDSEKVFADWRDLVEGCIAELKDRYETGSRREDILKKIVKEREREWQAKYSDASGKSLFIEKIINPRTSILTSIGVGAAYAAVVKGDPIKTALVAGGGSIAKDVLVLLADTLLSRGRNSTSVALKSHFMAFGATAELQPR